MNSLLYTTDHEWVRRDDNAVRFGLTDYAQSALGDIVFVNLPDVGDEVVAGEPCGEVESHKSVSDLVAPISGTVAEVNGDALEDPAIVNSDPFGAGWLIGIDAAPDAAAVELLDQQAYDAHVESQ